MNPGMSRGSYCPGIVFGSGIGGKPGKWTWRSGFVAVGDVDKVVGHHSKSDPSLHPSKAFIAGALSVQALENADTAFGSGAPFLQFFEPTPLLHFAALFAESSGRRN